MAGCCGCSIEACWGLYYAKLVFSVFSDSLRKAMYISLFRSTSIVMWCCLTDESASAFNSLAISLRACLFDLICFDFLRGATTVLCFFSGAS